MNEDRLLNIMRDGKLYNQPWWNLRKLHARIPSAHEQLMDLTGNHLLIRQGSNYPSDVADNHHIKRQRIVPFDDYFSGVFDAGGLGGGRLMGSLSGQGGLAGYGGIAGIRGGLAG